MLALEMMLLTQLMYPTEFTVVCVEGEEGKIGSGDQIPLSYTAYVSRWAQWVLFASLQK